MDKMRELARPTRSACINGSWAHHLLLELGERASSARLPISELARKSTVQTSALPVSDERQGEEGVEIIRGVERQRRALPAKNPKIRKPGDFK